MSRPVLLVFLLVVLIITSQFEWKQQLVPDLDVTPSISQKPSQSSKREDIKEKIILLQEKNIQRLNEIVRGLREQLQQCKSKNDTRQQTVGFLTDHFTEVEEHELLED